MSTADALRAQIAARGMEVQQAEEEKMRAYQAVEEAKERQILRRQLDKVEEQLRIKNDVRLFWNRKRNLIDEDVDGDALPSGVIGHCKVPDVAADPRDKRFVQGCMDCDAAVVSGEVEWRIKGFSWLRATLVQREESFAHSPVIDVGGHSFCLLYHPERGGMGRLDQIQRGSLVINHEEHPTYKGVVFRYQIWIKSKDRGFIQWGNTESICIPDDADDEEDAEGTIFGPDVCSPPHVPDGIWGMSHEQLEKSEWVVNDVLTVKLKVDVRPNTPYIDEENFTNLDAVSPSTLGDQLLKLLDTGASCDVTFLVQGETIRAHSPILSARSGVFQRQFACGMRESISKEVNIEDCEAAVFKAFLRHLYSDSFSSLEEFLEGRATDLNADVSRESTGANTTPGSKTKMSALQQLMAVSHKYGLTRMQQWCERQLLQLISVENVCNVLCQAHLHEARKLQENCLSFIKARMTEVVKTDAFGSLSAQWPQVCLEIMLHNAAVPECAAATAAEKFETARKRKRED